MIGEVVKIVVDSKLVTVLVTVRSNVVWLVSVINIVVADVVVIIADVNISGNIVSPNESR